MTKRYEHRAEVRSSVQLFGGRTADQAVCSCKKVGPYRGRFADAQRDADDHMAGREVRSVREVEITERRGSDA